MLNSVLGYDTSNRKNSLCSCKDMFYSKCVVIPASFTWNFNTDIVFSFFSLLCKQIDLSVPWNDLKVPEHTH